MLLTSEIYGLIIYIYIYIHAQIASQHPMATNGNSNFFFLAILPSRSHIRTGYGFSIREVTIDDLQLASKQNQLTSRQLVELYIGEIWKLNPVLHGVIKVNLDALYEADKADTSATLRHPGHYLGCMVFQYRSRIKLSYELLYITILHFIHIHKKK